MQRRPNLSYHLHLFISVPPRKTECANAIAAYQKTIYTLPCKKTPSSVPLFPSDQFKDCRGHTFQVVSMDWFPFLSFTRDSQRPGTTVTPQDSVDVRMLSAVARTLNFT